MPATRGTYPLTEMTASELSDYRRQLEQALNKFHEGSEVHGLLSSKLADVKQEQDSREK